MKQKAAAFLAVCMTVGSLPAGSAAAVPAETNGTPEDSNVAEIIEFDPVKLKDAMDQAVKNDEMVTPPTVVASSSDITGFSSAVFELKDAEKLLVTGSDMPDNTDVRIFLAPESEGYGEDGEYSLTGNESMIFMVENQGGEDQGYQLLFGNRITDVIEVKSKDRLLAEYYNPEDLDKATDSDAATPSESEAFETESGEDPTATGSETVAAAERSLFDRLTGMMVAYGAELKATASESGEFGENGRDEAEVPSAPAEENTEDEKEPSLPQETVPETEAPQESVPETEETQESRPEAEAPAETAPETETEAAEEEEMNHFTAYDTTVDENGYVRLSSGEISSSLLVVKNSFDKVDAEEGMDEPMAIRFAATKRMAKMANEGNGIALTSMDDEAETVADSKLTAAAFFVTTAANVLANGDDGESPFTVNLYDYAGTGSNPEKINNYLSRRDFGSGESEFSFADKTNGGSLNSSYRFSGDSQTLNIRWGILDRCKDLIEVLFPEKQDGSLAGTLDVYSGVDVSEFFNEDENGHYTYDSDKNDATYDYLNKTLKQEEGSNEKGFWPFGGYKQNNFFGMSMSFDFYKPENGKNNGEDMVFSFSGDDDVWVFLTNPEGERELILDMGGNHGRMDGSINFATGEITYSNINAFYHEHHDPDKYNIYDVNDLYPVIYNLPNGENCQKIRQRGIDKNGDTWYGYSTYTTSFDKVADKGFLNNEAGQYTLEFYYLERGGDSNCKLDFNLIPVPKQGIALVKQVTGLTDAIDQDKEYSFQIVSSDDKSALESYRSSGEGAGEVTKSAIYRLKGGKRLQIDELLEDGEYFYIQEINPGTDSVYWGSNVSPEEGSIPGERKDGNNTYRYSAIYQMADDSDTGFLFTCTNEFGKLQPQVGKTAYQVENITDDGVYDVTIQVEGSEVTSVTGDDDSQPVDLVVVMDKSGSISRSDYNAMKQAVVDAFGGENGLPEGSYISSVAFSDDGLRYSGANKSYEDSGDSYYDINLNWIPTKNLSKDSFSYDYPNGNTHSAAGFRGAINQLGKRENSTNKKVVVYMTDGVPTLGLKYKRSLADWTKKWRVVYDLDDCIEAAQSQLQILTEEVEATVYTIGYSGSNGINWGWLKPESQGGEDKYGIEHFYEAKDIDEVAEALGSISHEVTTVTKVQNPVVTDKLGDFAEMYETQPLGNMNVPVLYYNDRDASEVRYDEDGVANKGQKLSPEMNQTEGTIDYYLTLEGQKVKIAVYDYQTETVKWYVNGEGERNLLGSNEYRTLTFRVKATGEYKENPGGYPNISESGTGTHSGERGYYSNDTVTAYLTYENEPGEQIPLPKPVIRPVQQYTKLILSKDIEGDYTENWSFDFYIGLDKPMKDAEVVSDASIPDELNEYDYVYKVTLSNGMESETFSVPIGAQCQVLEGDGKLADHYKVTGTKYRVGSSDTKTDVLTNEQTITQDGLNIQYTNTISQYSKITIHKNVVDNTGTIDPDTSFTFEIKMNEGSGWVDYGEDIQIVNKKSAEVWIDPDDVENKFQITETNTQGAWKTTYKIGKSGTETQDTSAVIDDLEKVRDIYFTNYYYDHSITVEKKVDGEELIQNAEYPFEVEFTVKDGEELLKEGVNATVVKADGISLGKLPVSDENYRDNTLSFKLKAGEKLIISNLPQSVTGYEVKEKLKEFNEDIKDDSYEVDLKKITVNGYPQKDVGECTVTKDLAAGGDQNDEIVYTNQYKYLYGELTINKMISKEAPKEDTVFTFKVTDSNGKVFYATVKVDKGTQAGKTTLENIPAGTYTVEEIDSNARYELADDQNSRTVTVLAGSESEATVTFTNQKTTDSYFSDVSTVVNTVDDGKFKADPAPDSLPTSSPQLALQMNAGAFLLPGEIRMQPNDGDEMIQPA